MPTTRAIGLVTLSLVLALAACSPTGTRTHGDAGGGEVDTGSGELDSGTVLDDTGVPGDEANLPQDDAAIDPTDDAGPPPDAWIPPAPDAGPGHGTRITIAPADFVFTLAAGTSGTQ